MSCIKSIQRGVDQSVGVTTQGSFITINPVDLNKAFVIVNSVGNAYDSTAPLDVVGFLTSATTLSLSALTNRADHGTVITAWQVIEFI